jgi:monoamine oxidase
VVYPSHGIGDGGKGVLCVYTVSDDAEQITLLSKVEASSPRYTDTVSGSRHCYAGGDEENDKFLTMAFFQDWRIAAVFYHPGRFLSHYPELVRPRSNIYIAGGHLTPNSVWIVGALESAKRAVQQLVLSQVGNVEVNYI